MFEKAKFKISCKLDQKWLSYERLKYYRYYWNTLY